MTVFKMRALRTRVIWEICLHLVACRTIFVAERLIADRVLQNLFATLADLKISADIWYRHSFQTCADQLYILFCCGIPMHLARIFSIYHNESGGLLKLQLFKVNVQKTRIGVDICLYW